VYFREAGVVSLVTGVLYSMNLAERYWRARKYRHWASVMGEITRSEPEKWRTYVDDYGPADPTSVRYVPRIEYAYVADRLRYGGSTVSFEREYEAGPLKKTRKLCGRYAVGWQVRVYYKPGSPQTSCLEVAECPGRGSVIVAGILLVGGIVLASGVFGS